MKTYRLIKTYPGSPKLGTIVYLETEDNYMTNMENDFKLFPKKIVENYTEFWEEVVEKDYEILSIKCKVKNFGSYILNKIHNGKFANEYKQIEFNSEFYDIHSVKRLSDGEIFTIGDKTNGGSIKEIWLLGLVVSNIKQPDFIHIVYNHDLKDSIYPDFNDVQKLKQPLFTTEDGVDIFENNITIYRVDLQMWKLCSPIKSGRLLEGINLLKFSTKEKAEEYILMNKPCLSLTDLKNLGIFNETHYCKRMWITIKELVKQKLNK